MSSQTFFVENSEHDYSELELINDASPQMNLAIFGALFIFSFSILILNSQFQKSGKYVNVPLRKLIAF